MKNRLIGAFVLTFLATATFADEPATAVAVGKASPDITMTGIDGKEFKLSDVAKRGKNTVLMFSRAHW